MKGVAHVVYVQGDMFRGGLAARVVLPRGGTVRGGRIGPAGVCACVSSDAVR